MPPQATLSSALLDSFVGMPPEPRRALLQRFIAGAPSLGRNGPIILEILAMPGPDSPTLARLWIEQNWPPALISAFAQDIRLVLAERTRMSMTKAPPSSAARVDPAVLVRDLWTRAISALDRVRSSPKAKLAVSFMVGAVIVGIGLAWVTRPPRRGLPGTRPNTGGLVPKMGAGSAARAQEPRRKARSWLDIDEKK
jgi:hypothetical protein